MICPCWCKSKQQARALVPRVPVFHLCGSLYPTNSAHWPQRDGGRTLGSTQLSLFLGSQREVVVVVMETNCGRGSARPLTDPHLHAHIGLGSLVTSTGAIVVGGGK